MTEFKTVQVFQVGQRTIIGICGKNISESYYESEVDGLDILPLQSFIIIKHPMILIEFLVPSPLDETRQILTQQLKPFFGNPKFLRINVTESDLLYSINDPELMERYNKIIESIDSQEQTNSKQSLN